LLSQEQQALMSGMTSGMADRGFDDVQYDEVPNDDGGDGMED